MADQPQVPHRVQVLGVALRPTLQRLELALRQRVRADQAVYSMLDTARITCLPLGRNSTSSAKSPSSA